MAARAQRLRILKPTSKRSGLRLFAHRAAKDFLCGWLYPRAYRRTAKRKPLDARKVVFVESKLGDMPDSFELIWKHLEKSGNYDLEYRTLGAKSVGLPTYMKNGYDLVKDIADARCVFLCDANDVVSSVPLRAGTDIVQLWHACGAFKKWGMSTVDKLFGATREDIQRHPYYGNLSLVTVSSSEIEWAYCEAMKLEDTPEVVKPVGVSRTDVFFDEDFLSAAKQAVLDAVPGINGRKIILYAPTFRGHVKDATGPGDLDIELMKEQLGDEYALLIKHHPYVLNPPAIPESCKDFAFMLTGFPIDKLLCTADVCITDYSSIVFEYSLFNRPIAFFAPDIAEYDDWRGFYYDYDELTPGPVFAQTAPLVEWIAQIGEEFDDSEISAFREKFMGACDGHSTERILKTVGLEA